MSGVSFAISIIGAGYVGLTTGVALAFLGHKITAIDKDPRKVALLEELKSPIHENGLDNLLRDSARRFVVTDSYENVGNSDIIIIAVGTPPKLNGEADTQYVEAAAREIALHLKDNKDYVVVVKSTVPIGSNRRVASVINKVIQERSLNSRITFASNPEFLREGRALHDTFYPDRIVVGSESEVAIAKIRQMYQPILEQTFTPPVYLQRPERLALPPLITTDPTSAEMIKYASNAFLAVKISFINEIAGLCEKVGADVLEVSRGIGLDSRIGDKFLQAGLGWGGSCFPKDTQALEAIASEYNYNLPIIHASREVNARQRTMVIDKLQSVLKVIRGRTISVLGLAFKPGTDDVRDSPGMEIVQTLVARGAHVKAHDPIAVANARQFFDDQEIEWCESWKDALKDSDALLIATEWEEYKNIDWVNEIKSMNTKIIIDARNLLPHLDEEKGEMVYVGIGR